MRVVTWSLLGFLFATSRPAEAQDICVFSETGVPLDSLFVEVFTIDDASAPRIGTFYSGPNRCVSISTATRVELTPGFSSSISVYPNPVTSAARATIRLAEPGALHVGLFDLLGRRIRTASSLTAFSHEVDLDTGNLGPGTYFLRFASPEGRLSSTRSIVVLGGGQGSPSLQAEATGSISKMPARKTGSVARAVRVTRLGYLQTRVELDDSDANPEVRLAIARIMRVHGVDMADHSRALRGGQLTVEELRSGFSKTVPFGRGFADVPVESDSMRLTYARVEGDTTFTSGRSAVRRGIPGQYGTLLTASYADFIGGPMDTRARDVTLFAMDDSFPWITYLDSHTLLLGYHYEDFFRQGGSHPNLPSERHQAVDWNHPAYRRHLPADAGDELRSFSYYFDRNSCGSAGFESPSVAVMDSVRTNIGGLGAITGNSWLRLHIVEVEPVVDEYLVRVISTSCAPRRGTWSYWYDATGEMRDMMFGFSANTPSSVQSDGSVDPGYWVNRREVLRVASNLLGNPDHSPNGGGSTWPRVTQAPEDPAITDWAKRWFAVNTAFGPIDWAEEYSISDVRGLWWSIYWGK
jgi:hypothetical protein